MTPVRLIERQIERVRRRVKQSSVRQPLATVTGYARAADTAKLL